MTLEEAFDNPLFNQYLDDHNFLSAYLQLNSPADRATLHNLLIEEGIHPFENFYEIPSQFIPFTDELKSVDLTGTDIIKLGSNAFGGNRQLTSVYLNDSLEVIDSNAFLSCQKLTDLHFGKELKAIHSAAFEHCVKLKDLVIPDKVVEIGDYAFSRCYGLERVQLGDSVSLIQENAFCQNPRLRTVILPQIIGFIGAQAFADCTELREIHYAGTRVQFSTIYLGADWAPRNLKKIVCIDGDLTL